jgi:hypothetical protein
MRFVPLCCAAWSVTFYGDIRDACQDTLPRRSSYFSCFDIRTSPCTWLLTFRPSNQSVTAGIICLDKDEQRMATFIIIIIIIIIRSRGRSCCLLLFTWARIRKSIIVYWQCWRIVTCSYMAHCQSIGHVDYFIRCVLTMVVLISYVL